MSFLKNAQTFILCGGLATYSFCALAEVDTSLDLDADYDLDGPTTFYAGAGETKVWTGEITGTGPAVIKGGGIVAFSNPANTYSGGTLVSNAVFRLDAVGCAGTGAITGAVNTAHVYVNCTSVPNAILFRAACDKIDASSEDSWYPDAKYRPLYALVNTTFEEDVYFLENGQVGGGNSTAGKSRTITFNKDLRAAKNKVCHFAVSGNTSATSGAKATVKGLFVSNGETSLSGGTSRSCGTREFHSSSNVVPVVAFYHAHLNLKAKDAFPESVVFFKFGGSGESSAKVWVNGFDQTFRGISWGTSSNSGAGEDTAGHGIYSSGKATVRLIGGTLPNKNSSWKHYTALFDDVTFVLDVEQAYQSTFYTEFCNRKSTTSGDLIISNGDFRVSGTASFPNVPNIYVGTNGVFTSSSTRDGTFAAVTNMVIDGKMTIEKKDDVIPFGHRTMNLSLGSDAELTLPDDYTLTVLSLKVDGEEKPDGTYEADGSIDQLKSGTIVVQGIHETRYATWTGEGEGTSVGLAQNWSADVTGHLSDASLVATFATGGSTATVDRAMSLVGMNFLCARSFTLAGAYPISLEASGLAIDPTGVAGETYLCVEPHVAQMTQIDQVFDIPENATLDFAGGYSQSIASDNVKKGAGTLRLGGVGEMPGTLDVAGGTCVLSGTNRIDYAVTVTNGTVRFNGRLYQNAGSPGSYTAVSQLPGDRDMVVTCTLLGGSPRSKIEFDNAQIEKKFIVNAAGKDVSTDWFTALAGTTNTIKGQFCCKSTFGYATLEPDSVLRFAAPVYFSGETIFRRGGDSGTATVAFTNYTGRFTGGGNGLTVQSGVICRLESAAGSTLPSVLQITGTGRLECTADDALRIIRNDNGVLSATNSVRLNNTSVMDIGATRQGIALFNTSSIGGGVSGNSNAIVTGLPGSELKVFRGYLWQDVQGGVSVTSAGDPGRVLTATNRAYSSTGDIKAESGTFRFGANASWPNGTNVTICAGATLEVNRSRTFGDHAVLHAEGEDWTLSLASGVRQKFAQFYIDGVRQPDGVYGATGNGAVMYRMDNITGEGVIVVGTPGSVLILR